MKHGYLFNASATAAAGHFRGRGHGVIESQAPSALSAVGGYSEGRVPGFRSNVLSFEAAFTEITGTYNEEAESWDTSLIATVEGLDILGVLKADRVVARLTARHYRHSEIPGPDTIVPAGSGFEGLTIGGVAPDIAWNRDLLENLDTYRKITDAYEDSHSDFKHRYDASNCIGQSARIDKRIADRLPFADLTPSAQIPNKGGVLVTSLVESVGLPGDTIPTPGYIFFVPDFGIVTLARYLPNPDGARIDMVTVNFTGGGVEGACDVSGGSAGGQPMPPPRGNSGK